jgi:hypothetical protein
VARALVARFENRQRTATVFKTVLSTTSPLAILA